MEFFMKNDELDEYNSDWESIEDLEEDDEEMDDSSLWDDEESNWGRDTYFDEDGFEQSFEDDDDNFDYDESDYEDE
jgi:hypothetical protein